MRILAANLRLFYQNSRLWCVYVILGLVACVFLLGLGFANDPTKMLASLMLGMVVAGYFVGSVQTRVALTDLCSSLPGRQAVLRSVVFAVGLASSSVTSLLFLGRHGGHLISVGQFSPMLLSIPSIFVILYLLGAMAGFSRLDWWVAMLFPTCVFLAHQTLPGASYLAFCSMIEHAAASYPTPIAAAGLASTGAVWYYMGRVRLGPSPHRDSGGAPLRLPGSRFGQFLLGEAARRSHLDRWKYACGALYETPVLGHVWFLILGDLAVLALIAYVPDIQLFVFVSVCVDLVSEVDLPVRSTFFPVAGRRERYFATMALVAALWVYSLLVGSAIILGANLLVCILPDLALGRFELSPGFVKAEYLWVPLVATPIVVLGRALYHANRRGFMVFLAVSMCLFFTIPTIATVLSTYVAFSVAALAWILCAVTFRRLALHSDLVWQKQ